MKRTRSGRSGKSGPAVAVLVLGLVAASCGRPPGPAQVPDVPGDYRALVRAAHAHLRERELAPAKAALERAVALHPSGAEAHNLLGIVHFLQENLRPAEECFLRAVGLKSDYAAAYNNLGNVHFLQGNVRTARRDLKKSIDLAPDSAAAHYSLAMVLFSQGKHEEGTACLSRGIALDPDFPERNRNLSAGVAVTGLTSPETYFAWARAYALQDHASKAVEFLEKAKEAGFKGWKRLDSEREFERIRDDPEFILFRQSL
ncbi:MAG: tetratricopeptide repeat protein [Candidatus Aminicenantes bacterium]|nr:tetratricopeptide repeat protein [Candidatus Aminicenantes bacterium]